MIAVQGLQEVGAHRWHTVLVPKIVCWMVLLCSSLHVQQYQSSMSVAEGRSSELVRVRARESCNPHQNLIVIEVVHQAGLLDKVLEPVNIHVSGLVGLLEVHAAF